MSSDDRVGKADPSCSSDSLDGSNVVVGRLGKHSSEGNGRCDSSKEDEERYGDGLLVEVGELLHPPSTDGTLPVFDDSSAACVGAIIVFVALGVFSFSWTSAHVDDASQSVSVYLLLSV